VFFVEAGDLNAAIGRSYNARYQGERIDQCVWAQSARCGLFQRKLCLAACGFRQRALRINLDQRGLLDDHSLGQRDLNVRCILQGDGGSSRDVPYKARSEPKPCGRTATAECGEAMNICDAAQSIAEPDLPPIFTPANGCRSPSITEIRITAADCAGDFGTEAMSPPTTVQTSSANLKLHPKSPADGSRRTECLRVCNHEASHRAFP
jgi:hypothetical protein